MPEKSSIVKRRARGWINKLSVNIMIHVAGGRHIKPGIDQ